MNKPSRNLQSAFIWINFPIPNYISRHIYKFGDTYKYNTKNKPTIKNKISK